MTSIALVLALLATPAQAHSVDDALAWVSRYVAIPDKPLPSVKFKPQWLMDGFSNAPDGRMVAMYFPQFNTVWIREDRKRFARQSLVHEMVHWAGGGECLAYTAQVDWMKAHGRDVTGYEAWRDENCRREK